LNQIFEGSHDILFYLSRYREGLELNVKSSCETLAEEFHLNLDHPEGGNTLIQFIFIALNRLREIENWNIRIVDVSIVRHINEEDGSLNSEEIVQTLARCFRYNMIDTRHQIPEHFVVQHLVNFYKSVIEEQGFQILSDEHALYPIFWMDKDQFQDFLLSAEDLEIPATTMVQLFDAIARRLSSLNIALLSHHPHSHSNIIVEISFNNKVLYWSANKTKCSTTEEAADLIIRFPHYPPLFDLIESYLIKNVPAEIFLQAKENVDKMIFTSEEVLSKCTKISQQLKLKLEKTWSTLTNSCQQQQIKEEELQMLFDTFGWLLEEWLLLDRTIRPPSKTEEIPFYLTLDIHTDERTLDKLETLFAPHQLQESPHGYCIESPTIVHISLNHIKSK
jgi:hypothetical protein